MEKPSVKFHTLSEVSWKSGERTRSASEESLTTTRRRFLTAPEVPMSDEEARKREEKLKELQKQKEKQKKKKKKVKQHPEVPNDDDKDGKRVQELQEAIIWSKNKQETFERLKTLMLRHMRALDDLTKLRNHYYHEYKDALDAKVIQQRKDIKKKSDELRRKIELKKLKEMEASHHVTKRLTRSVPNVDNTFLKNLPKSRLYQVMAHQSKLMRDGKLNSLEDVEKFWENVSDPETFHRMYGEEGEPVHDEDDMKSQGSHHSESSVPGSTCTTSSLASLHQCDRLEGELPLSRIAEDREPTRLSIKHNSVSGNGNGSSTIQQNNTEFKSVGGKPIHPKVAEMEQRFPRVEFPEMLALYMDLDPPKEDPEIVAMREHYRQRAKMRDKEKKRLRKMYEVSLTNQASTQRKGPVS